MEEAALHPSPTISLVAPITPMTTFSQMVFLGKTMSTPRPCLIPHMFPRTQGGSSAIVDLQVPDEPTMNVSSWVQKKRETSEDGGGVGWVGEYKVGEGERLPAWVFGRVVLLGGCADVDVDADVESSRRERGATVKIRSSIPTPVVCWIMSSVTPISIASAWSGF